MEQIEIWKPVVGYEGLYEVSSTGRVKALEKSRKMPGNDGVRIYPERMLKYWMAGRYPAITLVKNGIEKKETIHKLVALHHVENPENYTCVRHIDDNPMNCDYRNLVWGTQKMNMEDKVKSGNQQRGETVHNALLTADKVMEIRKLYNKKAGYTYEYIGQLYGVDKGTIGDVIKHRTWKHI